MILRDNESHGREKTPSSVILGHLDDWEEVAVDYLDGRLDPETTAAVDKHLSECPACSSRLQMQRGLVSLLHAVDAEDPPEELEGEVLGEILFPSRPVQTLSRPVKDEPSSWTLFWHRRIVQWAPAAVAVVVLLAAGLTYGLMRSPTDDATEMAQETTVAGDVNAKESDTAVEEMAAVTTTAAAAATTVAAGLGAGAPSSAPAGAEATTTTLVAMYTGTTSETTRDKGVMISSLETAGSPAYFVFDSTSDGTAGDAAAAGLVASAAVVDQITTLTGLEPLDESLWLDGPTFAAYVPREDAKQLVELLLSIGVSSNTDLGLTWELPNARAGGVEVTEAAARPEIPLLKQKALFPELSAYQTPQPAVAPWSFTTSTIAAADGQDGPNSDYLPPDEAGTHVLVVIFVRR